MSKPADIAQAQKRGESLVDAGRPAEAAAVFREILAADPDNGFALTGLGFALFRAGDPYYNPNLSLTAGGYTLRIDAPRIASRAA